jgi:hypothetical protein
MSMLNKASLTILIYSNMATLKRKGSRDSQVLREILGSQVIVLVRSISQSLPRD